MKIFSVDYFSKDVIDQIKEEDNTYFSKEFNSFLVTDKVYIRLVDKYNITNNEYYDLLENPNLQYVEWVYDDIESWIDSHFDGEDSTFFGHFIYLTEYSENVKLNLQDDINEETGEILFMKTDDWGIDIKKWLKLNCSIGYQEYLEEEIQKFVDAGFNIDTIIDAYETVKNTIDY